MLLARGQPPATRTPQAARRRVAGPLIAVAGLFASCGGPPVDSDGAKATGRSAAARSAGGPASADGAQAAPGMSCGARLVGGAWRIDGPPPPSRPVDTPGVIANAIVSFGSWTYDGAIEELTLQDPSSPDKPPHRSRRSYHIEDDQHDTCLIFHAGDARPLPIRFLGADRFEVTESGAGNRVVFVRTR
jgi:hypothetical protein